MRYLVAVLDAVTLLVFPAFAGQEESSLAKLMQCAESVSEPAKLPFKKSEDGTSLYAMADPLGQGVYLYMKDRVLWYRYPKTSSKAFEIKAQLPNGGTLSLDVDKDKDLSRQVRIGSDSNTSLRPIIGTDLLDEESLDAFKKNLESRALPNFAKVQREKDTIEGYLKQSVFSDKSSQNQFKGNLAGLKAFYQGWNQSLKESCKGLSPSLDSKIETAVAKVSGVLSEDEGVSHNPVHAHDVESHR